MKLQATLYSGSPPWVGKSKDDDPLCYHAYTSDLANDQLQFRVNLRNIPSVDPLRCLQLAIKRSSKNANVS